MNTTVTVALTAFIFTVFLRATDGAASQYALRLDSEIEYISSYEGENVRWSVRSGLETNFHAFDRRQIFALLNDRPARWVISIGGSNSWASANTFLNHFYPLHDQISDGNFEHASWRNYPAHGGVFYGPTEHGYDVIFNAKGDIIFYEANGRVFGDTTHRDSPLKATLRITFLLANYFDRITSQLEWVIDQPLWRNTSDVAVMFDFCNRWNEPSRNLLEEKLLNFARRSVQEIEGLMTLMKLDTFHCPDASYWDDYTANIFATDTVLTKHPTVVKRTVSLKGLVLQIKERLGDKWDSTLFVRDNHWTNMMQHIITFVQLHIMFNPGAQMCFAENSLLFHGENCVDQSAWTQPNECEPQLRNNTGVSTCTSVEDDTVLQDADDEVLIISAQSIHLECSHNLTNQTNTTLQETSSEETSARHQHRYTSITISSFVASIIISFVLDQKKPVDKRFWSFKMDMLAGYEDDVLPYKIVTALDFMRFVASEFIVMGHLFQSGLFPYKFARFGFSWVPFYFMMSGFVLTTSQMWRESKHVQCLDTISFIRTRIASLYPAYIIGMGISLLSTFCLKGVSALPSNTQILIYVLLLQSWVPTFVENGIPALTHTWFISALFLYWGTFSTVYRTLKMLRHDKYVVVLMLLLSVGIPIIYFSLTVGLEEAGFYQSHKYNRTSELVDVAVLFLKYHPFAYFHVFLIGCTLPRTARFLKNFHSGVKSIDSTVQIIVRYGASISMGLYAILVTRADNVPGYKLSLRIGLISSVQALLLLGLTSNKDPIVKLSSWRFLRMIGSQYSFPQYIMQFIVVTWVKHVKGSFDVRYFLLLLASAIGLQHTSQLLANIRGFRGVLMKSTVFMSFAILLNLWPWLHNVGRTGASNMLLKSDRILEYYGDSNMNEKFSYVNPSLSRGLFVARKHSLTHQTVIYNNSALLMLDRWNIQVYLGTMLSSTALAIDSVCDFSVGVPGGDFARLTPCSPAPICWTNRRMYMKTTNGPEDAKIFKFADKYYISVFSYYHTPSSFLNIGSQCDRNHEGGMFMARINVEQRTCFNALSKLVYNESTSVEKNWGAFEVENTLYWIHSIHPIHTILETKDETLEKVEVLVEKKYSTSNSNPALIDEQIHGNVNPVRVGTIFLNIFHTRVASNSRYDDYSSFFYTFEAAPPFRVIKYGSVRIPLDDGSNDEKCKSPLSYVSSLEISDDVVIVAYGVCDLYSRILTIPIADVLGTYF